MPYTTDLLDPYAKALTGVDTWGIPPRGHQGPRRSLVLQDEFAWGDDEPPLICPADAIVYELHVRGFTQHPSAGVSRPGTFAGVVEKIPYLKALSVNVVELMPVWEVEEADSDRMRPCTGERLLNYWGYHPIAFFCPNASYAPQKGHGAQVRKFKEMMKSLHIAWHGVELGKPDWSWESRSLAMHLHGIEREKAEDIYFIANANREEHIFELPHLAGRRWCGVVDTMQIPPHNIAELGAEETLADQRRYTAGPRSVVVLVSR